uniref:Uncharacterized protein n=1 Tax=Setaria digitata TaxID=48799 RepID=A0A915PRN6_9BILA
MHIGHGLGTITGQAGAGGQIFVGQITVGGQTLTDGHIGAGHAGQLQDASSE